jgi:hypothetical protein
MPSASSCGRTSPPVSPRSPTLPRPDRSLWLQGVSFNDVLRGLLDAKDRGSDKSSRSSILALLTRLFFYEELPADVINQLLPLFQVHTAEGSLFCIFASFKKLWTSD